MYGVDMYITIKTLLSQGKSQREISRQLGIHRKTVRRMVERISAEDFPLRAELRGRQLDAQAEKLKDYLKQGLSGVVIHRKLSESGIEVAYSTLTEYLRLLRPTQEVYVPVHSEAGEEAQVDFGYLGYFREGELKFKVWVFCMVLSYSRYAYYETVTEQSVGSFIQAHIHAFEYFGGVPASVKIDNLKAGVIEASFYEPVIQKQYADFLAHYQCQPITARIGRGQDKGKVESGIKYVKNNFLKGFPSSSYEKLQKGLSQWNDQICNTRVHGTTRKVPTEEFVQVEKAVLQKLPAQRYTLFRIESRKVNSYGHIRVKGSYYSVPHIYIGKEVFVHYNAGGLKVFVGLEEIALHPWAEQAGSFVSKEAHKPPYKQSKSAEEYQNQAITQGQHIALFCQKLQEVNTRSWKNMMQGIFRLCQVYSAQTVNAACQKALHYQVYSYQTVKNICKLGLQHQQIEQEDLVGLGGYGLDLKSYDHLFDSQT